MKHRYLWKILKVFKLFCCIKNLIKKIHGHVKFTICINNFKSIVLDIKRGVKQRDSFSCLFFNIIIESLTRRLFQFIVITKSIALNKIMFKKKLYADDTAVYLNDFREWNIILRIYDLYNKAFGVRLNKSKTIIMTAGLITLSSFYFKDIKVEWRTLVTYFDIFIKVNIDYFQLWHKILQDFHTIIRNWFEYYLFIK